MFSDCKGPEPIISFDLHYDVNISKPFCCDELQSYYPWVQRGIFVFTFAINMFGVFLIKKRTPPSMKDFGEYLMLHQIAASNLDAQLSLLGSPSFLFPMLGVHLSGLYSLAGFNGFYQLLLFLLSAGGYIATVLLMLFARQQAILPSKNWFHIPYHHQSKAIFLIFVLILGLTLPICVLYPSIQKPAKEHYQEYYPCQSSALWDEHTFVLNHESEQTVVAIVNALMGLFFLLLGLLTVPTIYLLTCGTKVMSEKRRKMQVVYFCCLLAQISLPAVVSTGPIALFAVTGHNFYNRLPFNNIIIHITSLHGAISTITMICSYRCYRRAVRNMSNLSQQIAVLLSHSNLQDLLSIQKATAHLIKPTVQHVLQ